MTNSYTFTDNPMVSGVSVCDTDVVNDNLMYLKEETDKIPTIQTEGEQLAQAVEGLSETTSSLQTAVSNKADINYPLNTLSTSGTINLSDNSVNRITPSGAVTFALPAVSDNSKFHQILVQIELNTVYSINVGTDFYFNKVAPDFTLTGTYNLIYEHNGTNWVCGSIVTGSEEQ